MAKSLSPRFGYQRWSADADTQQRSEFDNDNAQGELLGAIARQGLAAARGSATTWSRSTYFSTDTGVLEYSDGTAWHYIGSDGSPRGCLGRVKFTTNQLAISGETALTGLSVTVTVTTGRRIRVSAYVPVFHNPGAASLSQDQLFIKEGATYLQSDIANTAAATSRNGAFKPWVELTPTAGSHTYFLSLTTTSGLIDSVASSANPAALVVEDIGI